jgi:hypothetical protein
MTGTEGVAALGETEGAPVDLGLEPGASVSVNFDFPVTGWPSSLVTRKATA